MTHEFKLKRVKTCDEDNYFYDGWRFVCGSGLSEYFYYPERAKEIFFAASDKKPTHNDFYACEFYDGYLHIFTESSIEITQVYWTFFEELKKRFLVDCLFYIWLEYEE